MSDEVEDFWSSFEEPSEGINKNNNKELTPSNPDNNNGKDWVADDALAALVEERSMSPEETDVSFAKRLVRQTAPMVANSLIHLALYAKSDSVRLRAGQYLMDKAIDFTPTEGDSELNKFLGVIEMEANDPLNSIKD